MGCAFLWSSSAVMQMTHQTAFYADGLKSCIECDQPLVDNTHLALRVRRRGAHLQGVERRGNLNCERWLEIKLGAGGLNCVDFSILTLTVIFLLILLWVADLTRHECDI